MSAAGPGFPGYPSPPSQSPSVHPATTSSSHITLDSTSQTPGGGGVIGGGASSNTAAPPASQSSATSSPPSQARTGLFQSQKSASGTSQPLLEPQRSFAFSARSLSIAASADGEAHDEREQQTKKVPSEETSAHSASFVVGVEEDLKMTEVRQRRLQRFHSSPISSPTRQEDSISDSKACATTSETGLTGFSSETASNTGVTDDTSERVETDI